MDSIFLQSDGVSTKVSTVQTRSKPCQQPSVEQAALDGAMFHLLSSIPLPESWRELAKVYFVRQAKAVPTRVSAETVRRRLARLRALYLDEEGQQTSMTWEEYKSRRQALQDLLTGTSVAPERPRRLEEAAQLMTDIGQVYDVANLEKRSDLISRLFSEVVVRDRTITAVRPSPAFRELLAIAGWTDSATLDDDELNS